MLDSHMPSSGLLNRDSESDLLERLVAAVCAGQSRVLVLRGEAGVGKTVLLRHLSAAAKGCRIARTASVESEMELAFAGVSNRKELRDTLADTSDQAVLGFV